MAHGSARSPRLLRRINSGALLRFALGVDVFTAAEAMEASSLTRATVLGVCDDLIEAGWLEEIEDSRAAGITVRGRPARRYRLRPDAGFVIGVDAGEKHFDAVLADLRGSVRARVHRQEEVGSLDRDGRADLVRELVSIVLDSAGLPEVVPLMTVVGVPAPVDAQGRSPDDNGPFWTIMNADFAEHLPGLVTVENDANLAALAEQAHAPARDVATLLTGERFGAGLIVDGQLLHGVRGGAGEMRFLDVIAGEDPDAGSADGLGALARRWARGELRRSEEPSVLRELDPRRLRAEDVLAAAAAGDDLAARIVFRLGERLAQVSMILGSLLDIDRVIVSGGAAAGVGPVLSITRKIMEARYYPPYPALVASTLGRDVIVQGAVELALSRIREEPLDFLPTGAEGAVACGVDAGEACRLEAGAATSSSAIPGEGVENR